MDICRYQDCDVEQIKALHRLAMEQADAYIPGPWDADIDTVAEVYLSGRGEFLVGLINRKIVAMGALRPVTKATGEIKRIRVHPDHQRRGLGQQILTSLESSAVALGFVQLELDTLEHQNGAIQFFQKNGYQIKGRRQFEGHQQLLLEKRLDQLPQQVSMGEV